MEFVEVGQAAVAVQVVRGVDHRLDPQRPPVAG
jgi:hypothetical protein